MSETEKIKDLKRPMFTSHKQDWRTPRALFQALDAEFSFNFDPCPVKQTFDGLAVAWKSRSFCNPPYSDIGKWIEKAWHEATLGKTVVLLVPARTDTIWWHEYCMRAREIRFIKGRLRFNDGKGKATFPSAIVIFQQHKKEAV